VVDHITRAEAAHLIGYLEGLENRGSDFRNLGNKLLELAKDSNDDVEVRSRCIQALGRINYTEALAGLKGLTNESLDNKKFVSRLRLAIEHLRQIVQERCN
jgi:HEAT repeat protein